MSSRTQGGEGKCIVAEVGYREEGMEDSLYVRMQAMIDVRKKALENIDKAQTRQKIYYDAKHSKDKSRCKVGALVLIKNARMLTCKGYKLEPNWTGPYQIAEVVGRGTFRLCHQDDNTKLLSTLYNMTRLKIYHKHEFDVERDNNVSIVICIL